jgi:hypothetical protein
VEKQAKYLPAESDKVPPDTAVPLAQVNSLIPVVLMFVPEPETPMVEYAIAVPAEL